MYSQDDISALLGEIYEGVEDPQKWRGALLRFLGMSGGRCAFLGIIDSTMKTLPVTSLVGPESSRLDDALALHRELIPLDPGLPYALARPEGGNFRFSETSRDLTDDPDAWRDFVRHDFGSGDYHSRFSAERDNVSLVMALHTPADATRLTPEQEWLHALAFEHLERAARLAFRAPGIGLARQPLAVVDADLRLVEANGAGEAILSAQDGLSVRGGRLQLARPAETSRLQALVRSVCDPLGHGTGPRWTSARRPSGTVPWLLLLEPIRLSHLGMSGPRQHCAIEIRGPRAAVEPDAGQWQALFGLTPREAEIAGLLMGPHSDLPAIAAHLGIGHETARTHMRSILGKCGVTNQLELVKLLASLA